MSEPPKKKYKQASLLSFMQRRRSPRKNRQQQEEEVASSSKLQSETAPTRNHRATGSRSVLHSALNSAGNCSSTAAR